MLALASHHGVLFMQIIVGTISAGVAWSAGWAMPYKENVPFAGRL